MQYGYISIRPKLLYNINVEVKEMIKEVYFSVVKENSETASLGNCCNHCNGIM